MPPQTRKDGFGLHGLAGLRTERGNFARLAHDGGTDGHRHDGAGRKTEGGACSGTEKSITHAEAGPPPLLRQGSFSPRTSRPRFDVSRRNALPAHRRSPPQRLESRDRHPRSRTPRTYRFARRCYGRHRGERIEGPPLPKSHIKVALDYLCAAPIWITTTILLATGLAFATASLKAEGPKALAACDFPNEAAELQRAQYADYGLLDDGELGCALLLV